MMSCFCFGVKTPCMIFTFTKGMFVFLSNELRIESPRAATQVRAATEVRITNEAEVPLEGLGLQTQSLRFQRKVPRRGEWFEAA